METWISDNFPLSELECQYFDVCIFFDSERCKYGSNCNAYLILEDKSAIQIRKILSGALEDFVVVTNLKTQVKLIMDDEKQDDQ